MDTLLKFMVLTIVSITTVAGQECVNDFSWCPAWNSSCQYGYVQIHCPLTCETCGIMNPCSSSPCLNGGACRLGLLGEVICTCPVGFVGNRCQRDLCNPSPCGIGNCTAFRDRLSCSCPPGFYQPDCRPDVCDPNPCGLGNCRPNGQGFVCRCPKGYLGHRCEKVPSEPCQEQPCLNSGICSPQGPGFTCECAPGFSGNFCQFGNRCDPIPRYSNTEDFTSPRSPRTTYPSQYSVRCKPGYTTSNMNGTITASCDTRGRWLPSDECRENLCEPNPCANAATCVLGRYDFECQCTAGFSGKLCDKDECNNPNPCNQGTCTPVVEGFICDCFVGYEGRFCEIEIPRRLSQDNR